MEKELYWQPIPSFEESYLINRLGDVFSIKRGKILEKINAGALGFVSLKSNGMHKRFSVNKLLNELFDCRPDGFEWIKDCGKMYAANKSGDIFSLKKRRLLNPVITKSARGGGGYCLVEISSKSKFVHRLVAETFIPNPENKREVNHINGIKSDNRVENLEWVTPKENVNHAHKNGLVYHDLAKLKKNSDAQRKFTGSEILRIRELNSNGISGAEICRLYSVSPATVCRIIKKITYKDILLNKENPRHHAKKRIDD